MNKYKIVLKGNERNFAVNTKGDINLIISRIMQYICEIMLENDIPKKDFINSCKKTYELVEKYNNEERGENND